MKYQRKFTDVYHCTKRRTWTTLIGQVLLKSAGGSTDFVLLNREKK